MTSEATWGGTWDCAIVGGGAAGTSAALVLGRARRRTLLLDAAAPSNLAAPHVGGLLGHDGTPPADLYALARRQLEPYASVVRRPAEVVAGTREDGVFHLELRDGEPALARRVLLATGMAYELPDLPGVRELWGDTVFHCPFCHGWELRDRPLAVLGRGESGRFRALLLRGWSDDVVLLTDGPGELGPTDRARLESAGVRVDERPVAGLVDCSAHGACGRHLEAVRFADGTTLPRAGLLVPVTLRQRSDLAARLGAETTEAGTVGANANGETSVPGLFAAGDLTARIQQVVSAAAAGANAAVWIHHGLLAAEHGVAPPALGEPPRADGWPATAARTRTDGAARRPPR
jgi:thioredoxin reductase